MRFGICLEAILRIPFVLMLELFVHYLTASRLRAREDMYGRFSFLIVASPDLCVLMPFS